MAASLPAAFKSADIGRFIHRASQLEKFKPAISYWCYYYVGQQILMKSLHNTDDECKMYTLNLMDKLEKMKEEHAADDTIMEDFAAQAFVEQFALDAFQRADNTVRANKVTAQTADTFRAASTFLDLLSIWNKPDAEIISKSKYAKYHALRIAKALKAGEDPNESNPIQEPEPEVTQFLDPEDPEVQNITSSSLQPCVEDATDQLSPQSPVPTSRTPSQPTSPKVNTSWQAPSAPPDVSPLEPTPRDRAGSVGGGYFPSVPTFTGETTTPSLPTAPADEHMSGTDDALDAANFYQPAPSPPRPVAIPEQFQGTPAQTDPPRGLRTDDDSVAAAEKHARWAISALNFEDVETAVKELKGALRALGAE
ncbi:DUF605-domain-containing protein [Aulographum hederae CBS 113979]|uniref:DUF605-domain-containing protein n=1 Tax=Aulographum hederae CBS 113979 TaxID=1176131 RepID=A0A6G1GI73_9PEZI|nr:DUF605-domain-containing protein [Aulographum hederae CBS 113979]